MNLHDLEILVDMLLDVLHAMVPVSPSFRLDLKQMMAFQPHSVKEPLLEFSAYALRAWFNVDAIIVGMIEDDKQDEIVVRIITGNYIFTDLRGFFQNTPSRMKYKVIAEGKLLFLKKIDFLRLKKYEETAELVQFIMLAEQEIESWRTKVMGMGDEAKVAEFAKLYPMNHLPNNICASFLQMTEPNYSTAKGNYNRKKE